MKYHAASSLHQEAMEVVNNVAWCSRGGNGFSRHSRSPEDESNQLWWSSDFSSSATIRSNVWNLFLHLLDSLKNGRHVCDGPHRFLKSRFKVQIVVVWGAAILATKFTLRTALASCFVFTDLSLNLEWLERGINEGRDEIILPHPSICGLLMRLWFFFRGHVTAVTLSYWMDTSCWETTELC